MPELPEVEVIVKELYREFLGASFKSVRVKTAKIVKPSARVFEHTLVGKKIKNIRRRGKLLIFELSGGLFLLIHLKLKMFPCRRPPSE